MQMALYCPDYGYYEKEEDRVGRKGDFYTSVSVGCFFGEMLAFQFDIWLEQYVNQTGQGHLKIVEAGAHGGALARDILGWMREHRTELFKKLEYWIIEPSPRREAWQRRNLSELSGKVHWVPDLGAAASGLNTEAAHPGAICGVIFSNELLDAFPIHRFGWDAKARRWFEWGVAFQEGQFVWSRLPEFGTNSPTAIIQGLPAELLEVLPDGFVAETCPAASEWWQEAAGFLASGRLMTIDYGFKREELLLPDRSRGTLRAYHRHHFSDNPLLEPGEQDLTAHVNFSELIGVGEACGLRTEAFNTQGQFLSEIATCVWKNERPFGKWTAAHTRQFQTLTHPEHLGRAFRVLIQAR